MKMTPTFNEGYPIQYESWLKLKDGRTVFLRPILQTDECLLVDLFNKLDSYSRHMRFLGILDELPEKLLFQLTHINYVSEFALVAVIQEDGKDAIIAVGRYAYDPQDDATEFAVVVRDDWQHSGLGKLLLARNFAIGKEHGISRFVTMIDPENNIIKHILSELGYTVTYASRSGYLQVKVLV
jgi:acetyltransferase